MQVILLCKIHHLGDSGVIVNVKPGYARNFLIPQNKAIFANKKNIASFEAHRTALEKENISKLLIAKERAKKIQSIKQITILSKLQKEDKIFGSVSIRTILKEMNSLGFKANKQEIRLPHGILKTIGEHKVLFQPHRDRKSVV